MLHLGLLNLPGVKFRHLFRYIGVLGFLGFSDNLAEASMLGVFLVIERTLLGLQLGAELVEHDCEDTVDGFLVGSVAVPDGDEVGVEADGKGDAAKVVLCKSILLVAFEVRKSLCTYWAGSHPRIGRPQRIAELPSRTLCSCLLPLEKSMHLLLHSLGLPTRA